jgi:hypothetical protein
MIHSDVVEIGYYCLSVARALVERYTSLRANGYVPLFPVALDHWHHVKRISGEQQRESYGCD